MRYVEAAGARVSAVGLGTWQFGSREWGYGQHYAQSVAPSIVERSLALGVNLVDTAEIYGFGRSERAVGVALTGRREEAFVASKLFPVAPVGPVVHRRLLASLGRLGIETIDLYQLHWPNPLVPIGTTMAALAAERRSGRLRHVGVSNFSLEQWRSAERALLGPVLSNQVRYSLVERGIEQDVLPWAQTHDRIVIAYSPLGQGVLSGRYDEDHRPRGARALTPTFDPENLRRLAPLLGMLREVASTHGATPTQVALAWLLRRPNVVVIPGASSVEQAESNAAAAEIELGPDEDAALSAASAAFEPVAGSSTLRTALRTGATRLGHRIRSTARGLRA
jgi:aryl-alcohol dehydrogenase-like predicted oxidoreductase